MEISSHNKNNYNKNIKKNFIQKLGNITHLGDVGILFVICILLMIGSACTYLINIEVFIFFCILTLLFIGFSLGYTFMSKYICLYEETGELAEEIVNKVDVVANDINDYQNYATPILEKIDKNFDFVDKPKKFYRPNNDLKDEKNYQKYNKKVTNAKKEFIGEPKVKNEKQQLWNIPAPVIVANKLQDKNNNKDNNFNSRKQQAKTDHNSIKITNNNTKKEESHIVEKNKQLDTSKTDFEVVKVEKNNEKKDVDLCDSQQEESIEQTKIKETIPRIKINKTKVADKVGKSVCIEKLGKNKIDFIRSGCQSGVDRAALQAARLYGLPIKGWCPKGGWAEDCTTPPGVLIKYPELKETSLTDVKQRTEWNAKDADATLVVIPKNSDLSRGTRFTLGCCKKYNKPCLVLDCYDEEKLVNWLSSLPNNLDLNVAGPRLSESEKGYWVAKEILSNLFEYLGYTRQRVIDKKVLGAIKENKIKDVNKKALDKDAPQAEQTNLDSFITEPSSKMACSTEDNNSKIDKQDQATEQQNDNVELIPNVDLDEDGSIFDKYKNKVDNEDGEIKLDLNGLF